MTWILMIVGALIGAALGGLPGFLAMGFLGWLVGFIIKSNRETPQPAPSKPVPSDRARIEALERRVASLEQRLGSEPFSPQKPGPDPGFLAASPAPEQVAEAVPAAEPISEVSNVATEPETAPAIEVEKPGSGPGFIVRWFTGGNTIVRVGLVILFVGLAFLVKYGVEHQMIPVELRIAAVAAAGVALLVMGWRLREKRAGYALSMQGGGVAVLYLTVFGSLKLYHLLPPGLAFAFLVLIAVLSAFLAIAQDSLAFAIFGAAGGFLAPVLASTGSGSHILLFSYYLVLNAGIFAIAWFRSWRALNVVGFLFTFLIGLAWGQRSYEPSLFPTTEPFLIAFFGLYVAIAILFARGKAALEEQYVDGTIVFGVPLAAFGLQAGLMKGTEFGLAFSSLAGGALYIVLTMLLRRAGERFQMLCESFLALGVVFITLAIPLALDARWTSAAWALEGAAIIWIGARQDRRLACAFGALLQVGAGVAFLKAYPAMSNGDIPLVDAKFVGAVLISVAGLVTYRVFGPYLRRKYPELASIASMFFIWGVLWWLGAGFHEIDTFLDSHYEVNAIVAFVAATVLVFALLGEHEHWEAGEWPTWLYAPFLFFAAIASLLDRPHPLGDMGWVAWPFAFIVHFAALRRQQEKLPVRWSRWMHAIGAVVLAMVGAEELVWVAEQYTDYQTAWSLAAR
ncbi:MAG TPA: DUF2339 domain-containing protein, partial [Usitatibacter sp.]|nr:DUF2339 domain-containing protein [Usitatibacter sp.]